VFVCPNTGICNAVGPRGHDFFFRVNSDFRRNMRLLRQTIRVLDVFGRIFEDHGRILEA